MLQRLPIAVADFFPVTPDDLVGLPEDRGWQGIKATILNTRFDCTSGVFTLDVMRKTISGDIHRSDADPVFLPESKSGQGTRCGLDFHLQPEGSSRVQSVFFSFIVIARHLCPAVVDPLSQSGYRKAPAFPAGDDLVDLSVILIILFILRQRKMDASLIDLFIRSQG